MATNSIPEKWEIWHARSDYSEGRGYKFRPVIIVDVKDDAMIIMMVTSSTNKLSLKNDYAIAEWKAAGLNKPSIARADRIIEAPIDYPGLQGRIGRLRDVDIVALKSILNSLV